MVILETGRLTLRKFTEADTSFILELLNTPGWLQFIGDRKVRTLEDARLYLVNGPLQSYRERGFGLYMVQLGGGSHDGGLTEGVPIGMCGFLQRDYLQTRDIGYAFLPSVEGMGYAFEAVSATLAHGRRSLGLGKVAAIVQPDNARSIRLLERLGFAKIRAIDEKSLLFEADGSMDGK